MGIIVIQSFLMYTKFYNQILYVTGTLAEGFRAAKKYILILHKLDALMILIYDVNDGMWESKGNFWTTKKDNDNITIQPTNDGKFNLDILCVSLPFIYITAGR